VANWCEVCDRPEESDVCDVCGAKVVETKREPVPWRCRFFAVVSVIYVGWRIYQLISWIAH
jgi:predicted RNA-binding protein with PUA domain